MNNKAIIVHFMQLYNKRDKFIFAQNTNICALFAILNEKENPK